jgi:Tfp pilus assembly protein PilF
LHRLGRAYLAVNQPAAAAKVLARALTRAPEFAQVHADLAMAQLGSGHPHAALATLDRALAIDPAHAGAAQLRGEINARLYGGTTP